MAARPEPRSSGHTPRVRRRHTVKAPDAYTRSGRFSERGDVIADRAVDPITGLPVLVYRFPGEGVANARRIVSDDVWKVLDHGADDRGGFLVSNLVEGAAALRDRPAAIDDDTAERAFTVVAQASAVDAPHGDLGAHRLYRRGDQLWVEGYGVPWSEGATPADDARALARSLLALEGHGLSAAAVATLQRTAEDGDAATAATALRELAAAARRDERETPPAAPASPEGGAPGRRLRNAASEEFGRMHIEVDEATVADPPWAPVRAPGPFQAIEDPAQRAGSTPDTETLSPSTPRFSKELPPDVTYRSGEDAVAQRDAPARVAAVVASVRDRRRLWLIGLLIVAAIGLALVTVMGGREPAPVRETIGTGGSFVVDVSVSPASLPPVSLEIVSSPPGSRHASGTVIRTVPDKVVLDREGTWRLQGRFEGRRSEIVTIVVPNDPTVVLPFRDAP